MIDLSPNATVGYHVWDNSEHMFTADFEDAKKLANEGLKNARDNCDPEWPRETCEIAIYKGPKSEEDFSSLPMILVATEINVVHPSSALDEDNYDDSGEYFPCGVEYMCEYAMKPPKSGAN